MSTLLEALIDSGVTAATPEPDDALSLEEEQAARDEVAEIVHVAAIPLLRAVKELAAQDGTELPTAESRLHAGHAAIYLHDLIWRLEAEYA